tara:strand:- start:1325 stop:1453 length:129 start_codon:yes stop_codon:yes gene_type:complete
MNANEWVFILYLRGVIRTERDLHRAINRTTTPYLITDEIVGW